MRKAIRLGLGRDSVIFAQGHPFILRGDMVETENPLGSGSGVFASSTERMAWNIAARHLSTGQKDPVAMIIDGIEVERRRCIELLHAAAGRHAEIPSFLVDPDQEW